MSKTPRSPERIAACKAASKKLYDERREWGVCVVCGKPKKNGETTRICEACTQARYEYRDRNRQHLREIAKKRMDRYRAAGLCIYCGKPSAPNHRLCEYHRELCRNTSRECVRRRKERLKNASEEQHAEA